MIAVLAGLAIGCADCWTAPERLQPEPEPVMPAVHDDRMLVASL